MALLLSFSIHKPIKHKVSSHVRTPAVVRRCAPRTPPSPDPDPCNQAVTCRVLTVPLAQWALRLRRTDTSGPSRMICVAFWICLELGRQRGILPPLQGVTRRRRSPLLPRRRPRPLPNLQVSRRPRTRIVDHAPLSRHYRRQRYGPLLGRNGRGACVRVRESIASTPSPLPTQTCSPSEAASSEAASSLILVGANPTCVTRFHSGVRRRP